MDLFPSGAVLVGFILFIITYFISSSLLIKPTLRIIETREKEIYNAEERAKEQDAEAKSLKDKYFAFVRQLREQGTSIRAKARAEAMTKEKEMVDKVQNKMRAELERLDAELTVELTETHASMLAEQKRLAQRVAENILGRPIRNPGK